MTHTHTHKQQDKMKIKMEMALLPSGVVREQEKSSRVRYSVHRIFAHTDTHTQRLDCHRIFRFRGSIMKSKQYDDGWIRTQNKRSWHWISTSRNGNEKAGKLKKTPARIKDTVDESVATVQMMKADTDINIAQYIPYYT